MVSDTTILFDGVSKKYCKSLKRSMMYGATDIGKNLVGLGSQPGTLRPSEFWAVEDVSFEIKRGQCVGLMGLNGSGKTTLLKLMSGIFWPDKGKVSTRGRIGALIAVGAGFHPLLTGRENIMVNGAILGMSKRDVLKQFDAIIDFADIGDFLDTPVKYYSSGMFVRLGFAIAVFANPDILLIDEVLAVGDRNFQIKCYRKIHELKKRDDVTIVLVSHNEYDMREYTSRCVVMDHGRLIFSGGSEDAISFYINRLIHDRVRQRNAQAGISDDGIVKKLTVRNSNGDETGAILSGDRLTVDFDYETARTIQSPIFGLNLGNSSKVYFAGFWSSIDDVKFPSICGKGTVRVTVDPCDLPVDSYSLSVVVCEEEESNVLEWKQLSQMLVVERPNHTRGLVKLKQQWQMVER